MMSVVRIQAGEGFRPPTVAQVTQVIRRGVAEAGAMAAMAAPVATGKYRQSLQQTGVDVQGDHVSGWIGLEPHWEYVEFGRGPGKRPPVGDGSPGSGLLDWVKTKHILPGGAAGTDQALFNMAFAIQRRIVAKRARAGIGVAQVQALAAKRGQAIGVAEAARLARRSVRGTGGGKPPPLRVLVEWLRDNNIRPTHAEAQRMLAVAISIGIGKRGTRRFRGETPAALMPALARAWDQTVERMDRLVQNGQAS